MSAKIIDSRRYKTITKTELNKKKQKSQEMLKNSKSKSRTNKVSSSDNSNTSFITNLRMKKIKERKIERDMLLYSRPQRTVIKEPKKKIYIPKSFVIVTCVIALALIVYISAKIMKVDEIVTQSVFGDNDKTEENIKLENDYDLKIGLTAFSNKDNYTSNNLILNDLTKNSSLSLIKVDKDYKLKYEIARSIQKNSELEYLITLNDKYKIDIDDIKYSVDKILNSGEQNMYYDRLSNIQEILPGTQKNTVIIKLKESNPYFVYYLDFPLIDIDGKVNGDFLYSQADKSGMFVRSPKSEISSLKSITLNEYSSIESVVEDFVDNNLDVFFATSNNDMQLIGKKEYNVKKYKDGETLFIFGNKESNMFKRDEIRKALMYSLNRDEIVKNSDNNFIELIDLPFIDSSIKYKYDVTGSNNLMESNGWSRNDGNIYSKYEDSKRVEATLKLVVNSNDASKLNVAENIKNMALNVGINIEIIAVTPEQVQEKINSKDYDLVLATVYIDETPDIRFLEQYLNINDKTEQAFLQVENSSVEKLEENIQNLEYVLSDEVACIGIYARNINLVYQKQISGFEDINYMKIFSNMNRIGKIIK